MATDVFLDLNMSNTMCVTKRARTAYACERSEYTLVFISGVRVGKSTIFCSFIFFLPLYCLCFDIYTSENETKQC